MWPFWPLWLQKWKKMAPHEFLLPINLKKSKKLWKFGFFDLWPLFGLQKFFGLFFNFPDLQMSWIFQIIQIWIILKQFCHQIIFAEKFANRISVYWATARAEGFSARLGSWPFSLQLGIKNWLKNELKFKFSVEDLFSIIFFNKID